ncbi:amino acid ABC transporter permease [Leucobacter allii]|uniref:Amino acid ABC transporter permease n=1 Tax=Leucobacter allii TaxID=2932247 RepID=A0ABY4FHE2_9MICO|nr:amino acid ABC transporter permease [Leucobacter allii]UOQ55918.1 amino acid ABC transporter permease [Leucobacter allii]UOR00434.1 amino acid ABC transporter permease [Leucobacter allii]
MGEALLAITLAAGMTVLLTAVAGAVGIVLGAPVMLLSRSRHAWVRALYWGFVHLVRGVPTLVWLFIAFFGITQLGITLTAVASAMITLSVIAVASMAEIYRGGLNAITAGQWEASAALGLGPWSTARDVLFPQLFRAVSPTVATYLVGLIKESALASTIGVAEITFVAGLQVQYFGDGLTFFAFAGLLYLVLSVPLGALSRVVHTRLTRRYAVL